MIESLVAGFRLLLTAHGHLLRLIAGSDAQRSPRADLAHAVGPYWLSALVLVSVAALAVSVAVWLKLEPWLMGLIPLDTPDYHRSWTLVNMASWPLYTLLSDAALAAAGLGLIIRMRADSNESQPPPPLAIIMIAIIATVLAMALYWLYESLHTVMTTDLAWNDHRAWTTQAGVIVYPHSSPGVLVLREIAIGISNYTSSLWVPLAVLWAIVRAEAPRAIPLRLVVIAGISLAMGLWWGAGMAIYDPARGLPQPPALTEFTNNDCLMLNVLELATAALFAGLLVTRSEPHEEAEYPTAEPA